MSGIEPIHRSFQQDIGGQNTGPYTLGVHQAFVVSQLLELARKLGSQFNEGFRNNTFRMSLEAPDGTSNFHCGDVDIFWDRWITQSPRINRIVDTTGSTLVEIFQNCFRSLETS